ncbi:UDP-glucose 4-epimerase [Candidatus Gottesmanbacteria bacterium RIFCSPHIGHO2_02_FULL_39_14]|uniref:UDP-glucose 4-epimerase n=2 Tax=Candidatus Gottesmaniibacteriota TaxID=1752720 RepID=A0A1F5ZYT3_9BACT|nr:MAG: UDP-glucose 4-epimerase [Candidatus Gottesmanbacteria bacterium RIFCSPHIGHO2_02_FULL_39_14]OGG32454.1 MAG: UDP-glucose 4-epimerase [Candidatus Gottesmanbacteria bacterium RIFCSPLOWO2_02_FULL_38_8]
MEIKQVLVTGGAGYVGAVLVPILLNNGVNVKVIDWYIFGDKIFGKYDHHPGLKQIKGDIRDGKLMDRELDGTDAVIHLACISNDPSYELDRNFGKSINYDATRQLTDLAKKRGVARFIYASTSSVYGIKKEAEVTENLSLEPLTDYSKYKMLSEQYILGQQSDDFTVVVIRPATICGYSPRMRLDLTVNMLTVQALTRKKISVFGGKQYRPNIHIKDMAELYLKTLKYPKEKISGKIYNVGYQNYTILEIADMVKKVIGDPQIEIAVSPTNDNRSYRIASGKIKEELGFVPKHTVAEAIIDIKKAFRAGKIASPESDSRYYNIKKMKEILGK